MLTLIQLKILWTIVASLLDQKTIKQTRPDPTFSTQDHIGALTALLL